LNIYKIDNYITKYFLLVWAFHVGTGSNSGSYTNYTYIIKITGETIDWTWRLNE